MDKNEIISDSKNSFSQISRLLSSIKRHEIVDMEDFYDEIIGMSIKEMTLSENVSIPDINKRKLCNAEVLTNNRCKSDIQIFEGHSTEMPNIAMNEESISNFHSERISGIKRTHATKHKQAYFDINQKVVYNQNDALAKQFNTPTESQSSKYVTRRTFKNTYNYEPRGSNAMNKSNEFVSKQGMLSADRSNFSNESSRKPRKVPDGPLLKYPGCLSSKNSTNNLLRSDLQNPFPPAKRHHNDNQIKDKEEVFVNSSNLSASGSKFKNNSPVRMSDNLQTIHVAPKSGVNTSGYVYSNRYRSISFQNKLDIKRENSKAYQPMPTQRRSHHYYNPIVPAQNLDDVNFEAKIRARKAMRTKEFEKIYKESTEGALQTPPMVGITGSKASLKLDILNPITRKSLVQYTKEESQGRSLYHQMELLTSDRSQPNFHYPENILSEKEIPDEGNARKPEKHQTKLNDFQGNGKRLQTKDLNFRAHHYQNLNTSKYFNFLLL